MAEVDRRCPHCGAPATTRFCGECGAEIPPLPPVDPTADQLFTHRGPAGDDAPTLPAMPMVTGAVPQAGPGMFPTELAPTAPPPNPGFYPGGAAAGGQAWSGSDQGLWTGMTPVIPVGPALDPNRRRRRAVYGVLAVAVATAVVIVAALLIAPSFTNGKNSADRGTSPAPSSSAVVSSPAVSADPSSIPSSGGPSIAVLPGPSGSTGVASGAVAPTSAAAQSAVRSTVTVTATATRPTTTVSSPSKPTTPATTATTKTTPRTTTSKSTPKTKTTPTPTTSAPAFGVPVRNISCSSGFIVQLASEVSAGSFTQRISTLKSVNQVPDGALAAESTKSCNLFSGPAKTMILYTGPYRSPYDGCAARLAGPADAFIRGANPSTSHAYYSCLCPASARPPNLGSGSAGAWVGELQRIVADRLGYSISDLGNNWGTYTAGTKAAVSRFQTAHHLRAGGTVDARTWGALRTASC